jgi:hypothetical protein
VVLHGNPATGENTMTVKPPSPNDNRGDVKNPTNPKYKDDRDNDSRQRNPQDPKHQPPPAAPPAPVKKGP